MAVRAQQRFAQLQPITGPAFIGKTTGGSGAAVVMTTAQAMSILPVVTASLNGVVPAPGPPTGRFFRDDFTWQTVSGGGGGTVTSVGASGGSTGMSFSGSPVTGSGTLTLAGTLNVASGGTGRTSVTVGSIPFGNTVSTDALLVSANFSFTTGTNTLNVPNIKSATTTLVLSSNNGATAVELTNTGNFLSSSTLINFTTGSSSILSTSGSIGLHSASVSLGNLSGNLMEYTAASQRLRFYRSGTTLTTHNIDVTSGNAVTTSGDHIAIDSGAAYSVSGNGSGGNITITSGQKRAAGSGIDGKITLNSRSNNIELGAQTIKVGTGKANEVVIQADGSDSDQDLWIYPKGDGSIRLLTSSGNESALRIDGDGNIYLFEPDGTGWDGVNTLYMRRAATSPTTIPTDQAAMYVADITAGNSAFHFKTENEQLIKLYTVNSGSAYSITNGTTDRSFNANSTSLDELADVVSTLITDLKLTGLIA